MILDRRPDDFSQRNLLQQITLGLLSTGRTLDELLARYAPPGADGSGDPEDEGALFVLGLWVFTQRLRSAAAAAPERALTPPADPPAPAGPRRPREDLLR